MGGVDDRERHIAYDVLPELVGCIPALAAGPARNDDVLGRLYLLRDAVAVAPELGAGAAAVAEWINQAARLVRDESDQEQARGLLRQAAAWLAAAATRRPRG